MNLHNTLCKLCNNYLTITTLKGKKKTSKKKFRWYKSPKITQYLFGDSLQNGQLIISGRVQGVCYRIYVRDVAKTLDLKGFAKNLDNGTVEVVAVSSKENIKKVIQFCKNNPGYSKVKDVKISYFETKEEFNNFEIC